MFHACHYSIFYIFPSNQSRWFKWSVSALWRPRGTNSTSSVYFSARAQSEPFRLTSASSLMHNIFKHKHGLANTQRRELLGWQHLGLLPAAAGGHPGLCGLYHMLGDCCVKTQGWESIWGSTTGNKFRNQVRLYLSLRRIRATSTREASAVLYASKQRHQVMYCIYCCRASAAPLASGSANTSDLFLSHKVLRRSNITHCYHKFKYINTSLPRMCLEQVSAVWYSIQCCTPDNFGGNITMLQQSYYLHVVVGSLHGVSTCSFFEYWYHPVNYWSMYLFALRCSMVLYNSLQVEFGFFSYHPLHD